MSEQAKLIRKLHDEIGGLKAQLSSKSQECDQFKSQIESLHAENKESEKELVSVIESLRADNDRLKEQLNNEVETSRLLRVVNIKHESSIESLKVENERLKHELSYFDPINRVRELRKRCEDLEAGNERFKDILQKCKAMMERDKVGGYSRTYEGGDYWEEGSTYEAVYFGLLNF